MKEFINKFVKFLRSDASEMFVFYLCLIDIMFLPYMRLVSTNYSVLILFIWFIFNYKKITKNKEAKYLIIMTSLITLSTVFSFFKYDKLILDGVDNLFLYNVKVAIQFVSYFLYYILFTDYIKNNNIDSEVKIRKGIKYLFYFATVLAIIFLIDKSLFAHIKTLFNNNDYYTNSYLAGVKYLQYRYNFIWSDPNNPGYFFVAALCFYLTNFPTSRKEKLLLIFGTLIILVTCMSTGAFASLFILLLCFAIIFLKKYISTIKEKIIKIKENINFKNVIILIISILGILILMHLILKMPIVKESFERVSSNSFSFRTNIWSRVISNTNIFEYLLIGTGGTQVILDTGELLLPHSGELYIIYSFGLIFLILFLYVFFGYNKNKKVIFYFFTISIFIGFSINTIVGEQKMFLLYMLLYCYYKYNYGKIQNRNTYNENLKKLVSIVVPIYNSAKTLDRCINSLINQTYKNIEIILVNDGSEDDSLEICKKYEKNDDRIIIYDNENHGVSYTRNFGIQKAKGKYITFVDSDDYIEQNMIKDMLIKAKKNIDLVISGMIMRDKFSRTIAIYKLKEKKYIFNKFMEVLNKDYQLISICGPCCKLYKTEIIKENNIYFRKDMCMGEDTMFNIEYLRKCKNIVSLENIYYNYMRENPNSLFSRYYPDFIKINDFVFSKFLKMLNERNVSDLAISIFEENYFNILFSSINMDFKYRKNVTKEKIYDDINYLIESKIVQKTILKPTKSFKQKFKYNLIKRKKVKSLYWLFGINSI